MDIIEELAKNFTDNITNEIVKFQIENNALKSEILCLNEKDKSQINELEKLKAESESLEFEISRYCSEVCNLQREIEKLGQINSNVGLLLSQNRVLVNEKKSILEEIKKLNVQMQQNKDCKKQPKNMSVKSELEIMKKCIKESNDLKKFLVSANIALTDENNKYKQDLTEKDIVIFNQNLKINQLEQSINFEKNKFRELEQNMIREKNKVRELENCFDSYQNQVIENHMHSMIQEYSTYF